jgi:hypothetical protein
MGPAHAMDAGQVHGWSVSIVPGKHVTADGAITVLLLTPATHEKRDHRTMVPLLIPAPAAYAVSVRSGTAVGFSTVPWPL